MFILSATVCLNHSCRSATSAEESWGCILPSATSVCCLISPGTSCCCRAESASSERDDKRHYCIAVSMTVNLRWCKELFFSGGAPTPFLVKQLNNTMDTGERVGHSGKYYLVRPCLWVQNVCHVKIVDIKNMM